MTPRPRKGGPRDGRSEARGEPPGARQGSSSEHPFDARDEVFRDDMRSRLDEREPLAARVLARLEELGCRTDPYFDRLSIDEALSNAVVHGNRRDPRKTVSVRAFVRPERWGVEVSDEGEGFDWKAWLERLREGTDPYAMSGRGIALIIASGAEVVFLDGGRRVLIVRKR